MRSKYRQAVISEAPLHVASKLNFCVSRAEVIKIEHPIRGDDTPAWGPPYAPYRVEDKAGDGESAYYLSVRVIIG